MPPWAPVAPSRSTTRKSTAPNTSKWQSSKMNADARRKFRAAARSLGWDPRDVAAKLTAPVRALAHWMRPLDAHAKDEVKKMFVPLSSLISLFMVVCGPLWFPTVHGVFSSAFFCVILFVNYSHLVKFSLSLVQMRKTLLKWAENPRAAVPFTHTHAIFVPNYNEPLDLLRDTIARFAAHPFARSNYALVLAMEAAERDHAAKADALAREFRGKFKHFIISVHPCGLPGECRGKGANIAWATQVADRALMAAGEDARRVLLTITDADGALADLYFAELEREMQQNIDATATAPDGTQYRMFSPPIFFARNAQAVPALVRATDAAWTVAMMQNLSSSRGLHFPCSTYTLTLPLARHVGGWDTSADAIGEDLHMFLKCFYRSRGIARGTPIWCPVNLANVQADSYKQTLFDRYTQARRHFAGSADSLFALRHTFYPGSMDLPAPLPGIATAR
ncbi:hypothetical protein AMAG_12267 [Allomyces macrogynus ATCC 38327]|uniref:Glycosyltransferase 2-like domain-containing protein n=1 Tax=Allomyces macrogynus (strain ATCC 38327) TaxID=578462 RepID=A0A0L0SXA8_ALLM3|nr:hypothetical protein AMAG_12267 [Allomyces macrogynus ATCC 38327]|eukprot:KNE67198.1 hypothetical protein AMAG_12267 [Allomyces macrogynus ATCC 38327]